MEVAGSSVHSCHTALSNYSTIAATQVMEFQLKYDSFRICFCLQEGERRLAFMNWGAKRVRAWTAGRVLYGRHIFQCIFSNNHLHHLIPHLLSKRE